MKPKDKERLAKLDPRKLELVERVEKKEIFFVKKNDNGRVFTATEALVMRNDTKVITDEEAYNAGIDVQEAKKRIVKKKRVLQVSDEQKEDMAKADGKYNLNSREWDVDHKDVSKLRTFALKLGVTQDMSKLDMMSRDEMVEFIVEWMTEENNKKG